MGTSSSHSHVLVLISCMWSFVTSRCWTSKTFELQSTLAPELSGWKDVASQSSFGNNRPSRCINKTTLNCQVGITDVPLPTLEHSAKSTDRIRWPRHNFQALSTAISNQRKSQFTTSSFDRRLEPAHTSTPRVWSPCQPTWWTFRMCSQRHGLDFLVLTCSGCHSAREATRAHQIAPILVLQMDLMTLTQQASHRMNIHHSHPREWLAGCLGDAIDVLKVQWKLETPYVLKLTTSVELYWLISWTHHSCKWRWEESNQWHAAHHRWHQQSWKQPHERHGWRRGQ